MTTATSEQRAFTQSLPLPLPKELIRILPIITTISTLHACPSTYSYVKIAFRKKEGKKEGEKEFVGYCMCVSHGGGGGGGGDVGVARIAEEQEREKRKKREKRENGTGAMAIPSDSKHESASHGVCGVV